MSFTKEQAEALQRRVEANRAPMSMEEVTRRIKAGIPVPIAAPMPHAALVIDIDPMGAPRQSRRDAWKPSPAVVRYRAWKDKFVASCKVANWSLQPVFHAEFEIAMPASWSKKKKAEMDGKPHQQKPDIDNAMKGVFDSFGEDDAFVHTVSATKRWAYNGRIILYR